MSSKTFNFLLSKMKNERVNLRRRKSIAASRSMFIAITLRAIDAFVVSSLFVSSRPRPNLRFARLNFRSTSIRSVLSWYAVFLQIYTWRPPKCKLFLHFSYFLVHSYYITFFRFCRYFGEYLWLEERLNKLNSYVVWHLIISFRL